MLTLALSAAADETWRFELPPGFPAPQVPDDNPMSAAKVELGRRLFFDRRLSVTGRYACASCHDPARAFTDGRARAVGATGERHPRSAPSLQNVAYQASFGWLDPELRSLEAQAAIPMLSTHPIELGLLGHETEVMRALLTTERDAFEAAFAGEEPFDLIHVCKAIAAFERTLIAANTAYDRYVFLDEREALSDSARRGMKLFFSERLGCGRCHPGPLFMGPAVYEGVSAEPKLHDVGLDGPDGPSRFRAPTLRNVARTAPYMHDGSIATLPEVLHHYAAGGRDRRGADIRPFEIGASELRDVVAFLESLTDLDSTPAYAAGRIR